MHPAVRRRPRPLRARGPPRSTAGCASIVKCTMISEPSASVSSTVAAQAAVAARCPVERGVLEVLGPDAEHDASGPRRPCSAGRAASVSSAERELAGRRRRPRAPPFDALERRLDEVHRRAADEAADEEVDRAVVELLRRRDLLQLALAHDGDAVAHRHRLDLVVRDVDRRHAEVALEPRDLRAHLHAQLRVEVRERLVHQERLRLAHDRAAHRDALALAAGERARLALRGTARGRGPARRPGRARSISAFGTFLQPQAEGDVVVDGQVRVERVALEDHGDVAVARRDVVDDAVADPEHALGDVLEPGDHAQRRRLAAPDGPTSTMNSPSAMSRSRSATARVPSG